MTNPSVLDPKWLALPRRALRIDGSTAPESDPGRSSDHRRSAIPWGLVGMIVMVMAIECWVGRNWLDFSDPVSLSWRFSANAAATRAPGCGVLCLGDSLVKHGLFPAVLEQSTGQRTVNLSAAQGTAILSYFLLRRALDARARPAALILDAKPAVLIGGPQYNTRNWQEVQTLREGIELLHMTGRVHFLVSTMVGRLLPSLRARLEVQSNLMAALRGQTDQLHTINRVLWRNWTVNAGANVTAANSLYEGEVTPEVEGHLHPSRFHVDRNNAESIERLLKLAAREHIRVFWLILPLAPNLQALRDRSGAEARYERFVRTIQRRYPATMTVLDARRAGYPSAMFVDATHLSGSGGTALSRSVGTAIGAELTHPRSTISAAWIALDPPPARPAALGGSLEDLDESRRILGLDTAGLAASR
jgi:hypothetical protein